ncbi:hypothetical protein CY35_11G099600 [Sphagnum magellanicum]|nr:hypothetical protein CY35_11G099600 [Sphagnum magellanicum]
MRISSGVVAVVVYSTEQQRRKRLLLQVQLICLLLLFVLSAAEVEMQIINNNTPPPQLIKSLNAKSSGGGGAGIMEAIMMMENEDVIDMAMMSSTQAHEWVAQRIIPYNTNTTRITAIAVGNEIISKHDDDADLDSGSEDDKNHHLQSLFLLPAIRNLHTALVSSKLDKQIKVSTCNSILLLLGSSSSSSSPDLSRAVATMFNPPSLATFNPGSTHMRLLEELLDFLSTSQSPFIINLDVFRLYEEAAAAAATAASRTDDQQQPPDNVEFFVFEPNSAQGLDDPVSKLHYSNFLDTVLDSLFSAMAALNQTHDEIPVAVVMNPWPSSDRHAITFNQNLLDHFFNHQGTPMKPNANIQIFMYDADDADADDDGILSWATTNQIQHQLSSTAAARGRPRHRRLQEQWCVAKPNQASTTLQGALDWACGPLQGQGQVDCSPIQSTGACYNPNTLQDHCNWAFNAYYLLHSNSADPCDFAGSAVLTTIDPSTTGCVYTGITSSGNSSTGSGNTTSTGGGNLNSTSNGNSSTTTGGGGGGGGDGSITTGTGNQIEQQPWFWIAVVVAIMYILSGQQAL